MFRTIIGPSTLVAAKEDAARYELQPDILDSMGSDQVSCCKPPSGIATELYRLGTPLFLEIICSFIGS